MSDSADAKAKVTIYSTSWCSFCRMAKNYLKGLGVDFKDIDVEQDGEAAKYIVEKTKQNGVPVIEIGDQTILGFDRPSIDQALKANKLI